MLCYVFWSQVEYGIVCFISLIFGQMFWQVKSYICVEFGPMRTHKEGFGGLLELWTLMDSVW